MRVIFLTDGIEVPSSRFRVQQFFPAFRAAGIECVLAPAYGRLYNRVFSRRVVGELYKVACRAKRAAWTLSSRSYDLAFLQRTAFPQTALPEVLRSFYGSPLLLDFDDAIWLGPGGLPSPARERAFRTAVRVSQHVVAGNRWLASVADAPEKTSVVPSVVDVDQYTPGAGLTRHENGDVVIGWMGSATNFPSLRSAVPGIRAALARLPRARFRIVSNGRLPELASVDRVEQVPWRADTEVDLLRSFDIGVMPLEDTDANRGKCSFKMLQYMSVGRAAVASAVGANIDAFAGSEAGRLVAPGGDWVAPLVELAEDNALRRRMGEAGRAHVVAHFSVEMAAKRYCGIFRELVGGTA